MASAELETVDPASLDAFRAELLEAGFEALGKDGLCWEGPIAPPLSSITSAETMKICFQVGWPYLPPTLFVKGVASEHAVLNGELCLFQPGERAISSWLTLNAYQDRIKDWVEARKDGFRPEDDLLDPHLYFRRESVALATLEVGSIPIGSESSATGKLQGCWVDDQRVLALSLGLSDSSAVFGRWYYHSEVPSPPRDLSSFRDALTSGQQNNFDRRIKQVQANQKEGVFALLWDTSTGQRNCLVVLAKPGDERPQLKSLELAPTDAESLLLRAGPDVKTLAEKRVVIFGVGAIGSHIASLLARSGLGNLRLIENECLRPANRVRHAGSHRYVGWNKGVATRAAVRRAAPWTEFEFEIESPWDIKRISRFISDSELAVDATGLNTFAELISRVTLESEVPLVSAALFRGGFLGRVRRQIPGHDTPFVERGDPQRFPPIPAGDEQLGFELGCSAAVNNASPIAVAAISATTAEITVDLLSDRLQYPEEVIDVYRSIEEPFDRIGRTCG